MGQIQNAVLNTLGSVQQMVQLYKLTDTYAEQQENRANQRAEKAAQQKYEDLKKEYEKGKTVEEIKAKIKSEPFSKEEIDAYKKEYNKFYDNTYKDNGSRKKALTKEKGDITTLINNYPGDASDLANSLEYKNLVRKRQWLENEDFDYLFKGRSGGGKEKAQKSPQEQADTNGNIARAKKAAKGGKK